MAPSPPWRDLRVSSLFLVAGPPGAGKTTVARRLAEEHVALRLTPDEWMIPLSGASEADGGRDVPEGLLLRLAPEAPALGANAVLDFGCWSRVERSAIRHLAESAGGCCHLVHVRVDHQTQRDRVTRRRAGTRNGSSR